jgi:type IV secretory pathway TraG/TraD family ATPase VirD4
VEELALAVDQRLEEVDGVAVVRREVGAAVHGEEVVPAEKVSGVQGTYTSRLERYFEANMAAVTYCCYCSANILMRFKFCWGWILFLLLTVVV